MNVQLTTYGMQLLNTTQAPIKIAKYILGSSVGYIPDQDATGIRGNLVYSSNPLGPTIVNANVYQYSILLDYPIGSFAFGEVAFYDQENKCVAVGVMDKPVQKTASTNASVGNSIRLDCYLSMVNGFYSTWGEHIGSDISSQVPVIGALDNLPPVHKSDPNFYIIAPMSSSGSAVLAYSAGGQGLWHFDAYSYANMRSFAIESHTVTSITLDISTLSVQERQDLYSQYYGDKIIEFSSGSLYSICRVITRVMVLGDKATLYFKSPLALSPLAGDTVLFMSRTPLSVSQVPIATPDIAGLVKPSDKDFVVAEDGTLTIKDAVKTVNGVKPDAEGNIQINGIGVRHLEQGTDLNSITETGTYWSDTEVTNSPFDEPTAFVLEVIGYSDRVAQRITSDVTYIRQQNGDKSWTDWELVYSSNTIISCGTF